MGSDNEIPVACSAPGKVLFTGGYLVLDRQVPTGLLFSPPKEKKECRVLSIVRY